MRRVNAKPIVIARAVSGGCNHHLTPGRLTSTGSRPPRVYPCPLSPPVPAVYFLTVRFPASVSRRPLSGVPSPAARKPAPRKAARKIRMQNSRAKLYAKQPRMQNPARGICLKKRGANKKIFAKPARLGCRKAGGLRTIGLRVACLRTVCLCAGGLRVARL